MAEESMEKPAENHQQKNRRRALFGYLTAVITLSHDKISIGTGNSDKSKQGWSKILISGVEAYGRLLHDFELESLEERIAKLEEGGVNNRTN